MIFPSELVSKPRRAETEPGPVYSFLKRTIDIIGSGIGLLLLLPVFAVLAIAIRIDNPGPVFYVQERIGKNRRRARRSDPPRGQCRRRQDTFGRPFKIYKLRSMVTNAEKATGPVWASAADSRITRMGRFLRKTRLDETPQLWNVLRGDMSLVGPRPERPSFVVTLAQSLPEYPMRCSTLPGITGLAQVKSQYDSSIETVNRKLQYDLYYVRHGRFMLDMKIMAATVKVMARGEGAH